MSSLSCLALLLSAAGDAPQRLDSHGDPLPPGAVARLGTLRFRQGSAVARLAFSPDGKTLASAGRSSPIVRLWDVATGKEVRRFVAPEAQHVLLTFSRDGQVLVSGGHAHAVRFWHVATGKELRRLDNKSRALALSPDGSTLACGDLKGVLELRDAVSGRLLRPLDGEQHDVGCLAFSAEGKALASGSSGRAGTLRVWDVATGKERWRHSGRMPEVASLAFTPDGKGLLVAAHGQPVGLHDAATGKLLRIFGKGQAWLPCAVLSPNGSTVAAPDEDEALCFWDTATGRERLRLDPGRTPLYTFAFSPDGRTLAGAGWGGVVRLWEVASGGERGPQDGHSQRITGLAVAPGGRVLATSTGDGVLRLWDLPTRREVRRVAGLQGDHDCVAFSPDGKWLAASINDHAIRLWDAATGEERATLRGHKATVFALAFSADGKELTSSALDGKCRVWSVGRAEELRRLDVGRARWMVGAANLSPHGRVLAVRYWDDGTHSTIDLDSERFSLRDVATGRPLARFGGAFHAESLAFAPDGRSFAAVGWEGRCALWDVHTGKMRRRLPGLPDSAARRIIAHVNQGEALAFSPDGRVLAAGGLEGRVRLFDVASGKFLGTLTGHEGKVQCLAFSPDSKTLFSASDDTTVLIWNTAALVARAGPPRREVSAKELEALWERLAGEEVHDAIWGMVGSADRAVPFLRQKLRPVPAPDPRAVARLITELDCPRFETRDRATKLLEKLKELAGPALRAALARGPGLETRRRVEGLIQKLEDRPGPAATAEGLRVLRTLEVLEYAAIPEARQHLEALAGGAEGAWQTREARAALARLASR